MNTSETTSPNITDYRLINGTEYTMTEAENTCALVVERKDGGMIDLGNWFGFYAFTNNPEARDALIENGIIEPTK